MNIKHEDEYIVWSVADENVIATVPGPLPKLDQYNSFFMDLMDEVFKRHGLSLRNIYYREKFKDVKLEFRNQLDWFYENEYSTRHKQKDSTPDYIVKPIKYKDYLKSIAINKAFKPDAETDPVTFKLMSSALPLHGRSNCPKCGSKGSFVRMALVCKTHGIFGGI